MLDVIIEYYIARGMSIIPIEKVTGGMDSDGHHDRNKRALIEWKEFQERGPSRDEVEGWGDSNLAIVTGEVPGIVVVDVDGEAGEDSLKSLGGLPRTPTVRTGRGRHYYFKHPGFRVSTRSGVLSGIDIRGDGGYAVAPPSIHQSGCQYRWEIGLDDAPLADLPESILELVRKEASGSSGVSFDENDLTRARAALAFIPADERQIWISVGMALHEATGGSEEGYLIWTEWSKKSPKFREKEQRRQYRSFAANRSNKVTLASVFKLARDNGWHEPMNAEEAHLPDASRPETRTTIVRQVGDVTSRAMPAVKRRFREYNHHPSEKHWDGLEQIALTIQAMAGQPSVLDRDFIVSFLPPGMGKTTTVVETVRLLPPDVGTVIFLSRCEEIKKLAKAMGLSDDEFSVIVSKNYPEIAKLGNSDPKTARVLFTTQQMLEARVEGGRQFRDVSEFWFNGGPRPVRIWDEAILPSSLYTLGRYDITNMLKPCQKNGYIELANTLETFCSTLRAAKDRDIVTVPEIIGPGLEEMRSWFDRDDDREACETLFKLAGRSVRVRRDQGGNAVLAYEDMFPDDLGPMLILDASGKQRAVYEHWYSHRKGLRFLPSPQKLYSGLTVHHWDRGAGKTSLAPKKKEWRDIVDGIVKVIQSIPSTEPVLVVHFKPGPFVINIERELRAKTDCRSVSFLTWGKHTATNEFQDCKHVILAGVLQYSIPQNEAVGRMAKRLPTEDELSDQDHQSIRLGEIAHNIFQASCRGYVRKSIGDDCPPDCHLYIVFSTYRSTGIPRQLLLNIFPGAEVVDWLPLRRLTGKKQSELAARLVAGQGPIAKSELIDDLRLRDRYPLDRILDDNKFIDFLRARGIIYSHDRDWVFLNHKHIIDLGQSTVPNKQPRLIEQMAIAA